MTEEWLWLDKNCLICLNMGVAYKTGFFITKNILLANQYVLVFIFKYDC